MERTNEKTTRGGFIALFMIALFATILLSPASAWACFTDESAAENAVHIAKRPGLIGLDVSVPDDYVQRTPQIDESVFDIVPVFKYGYEEPVDLSKVSFAPTSIPEDTKGTVEIEVSYTYGDNTVTTSVPIEANVPPKTIAASSLGIGSKVKFGKDASITWRVLDKNHAGYPSNSLTLIATNYGKRPLHHEFLGTNDNFWPKTDLRAWLNSTTGFLAGWSDKEKSALMTTSFTPLQTSSWSSKYAYTDKVFILCSYELNDSRTPDMKSTPFTALDVKGTYPAWGEWKQRGSEFPDYHQLRPSGNALVFYDTSEPKDGRKIIVASRNSTYVPFNKALWIDPVVNIPLSTKFRAIPDASGCYSVYFPE